MTNGALYSGTISCGDLDAWRFTANAGDSLVVRVGRLTGTTISILAAALRAGRHRAGFGRSHRAKRRRRSR